MEKIRIRDEHPGSATLLATSVRVFNVLNWIRILFFSSTPFKMLTKKVILPFTYRRYIHAVFKETSYLEVTTL
jgi:hypothetical protein